MPESLSESDWNANDLIKIYWFKLISKLEFSNLRSRLPMLLGECYFHWYWWIASAGKGFGPF